MNNLVVGFSSSFDTRVNKTLTEDYETCKDSVERFDEIMIFECYDNEAYFRYVVVQLIDKGKRFLTIAEIEVAGECKYILKIYLCCYYCYSFTESTFKICDKNSFKIAN